MKFRFHSAARVEFLQAAIYYESQQPNLGKEFEQTIRERVTEIVQSPLRYPAISPKLRRCLADRFPYAIVYHVRQDEILIIAVAHHRRRPGYWRSRKMES